MALAATVDCFSEDDSASRILPAVCPLLIDKEKLVRDQATKTLDIYLSRVRKAASGMADSVLPPPSAAGAQGAAPRMSTPQPSEAASWTGWAISSFTNKISTAAGEIQPGSTSAAANGHGLHPASSAPASLSDKRKCSTVSVSPSASASALHRSLASPPASSASARTSTSDAQDYFADASTNVVDDFDAWGDMEDDPSEDVFTPEIITPASSSTAKEKAKPKATSSVNPFEDNGEPDFAGWLAAQAGKKPGAKALPKGLAKPAAVGSGRPATVRVGTTGSAGGVGARKVSAAPVVKREVKKTIDTKPKETGEDDWGDGWD
jgi:SCY1-like protein 1